MNEFPPDEEKNYGYSTLYIHDMETFEYLKSELDKQNISFSRIVEAFIRNMIIIVEDLNQKGEKIRHYRMRILMEKRY